MSLQSTQIGILTVISLLLLPAMGFAQGNSSFLADRHAARQIACQSCHPENPADASKGDPGSRCVSCHGGYPEMVKRTEQKFPEANPHDHHEGELSCAKCHKGHRKGENYCEECHGTFVFTVP